ncbi:hypothetical protein R6Q59_013656 [Mikania micrantha]
MEGCIGNECGGLAAIAASRGIAFWLWVLFSITDCGICNISYIQVKIVRIKDFVLAKRIVCGDVFEPLNNSQRIVHGDVPEPLKNSISFDMGSLLAGAKFEGVKCSYGRVEIMRSFRAKSYGSEMFIND